MRVRLSCSIGLCLVGLVSVLLMDRFTTVPKVHFGNHEIRVLLADSAGERSRGLSGRKELESDHGMLFVYNQPSFPRFWMKDMHFSVDIIWMDAKGRVVTLTPNVSPTTYPTNYKPKMPAQYVLEVPAGTYRKLGLKLGDQAQLPL